MQNSCSIRNKHSFCFECLYSLQCIEDKVYENLLLARNANWRLMCRLIQRGNVASLLCILQQLVAQRKSSKSSWITCTLTHGLKSWLTTVSVLQAFTWSVTTNNISLLSKTTESYKRSTLHQRLWKVQNVKQKCLQQRWISHFWTACSNRGYLTERMKRLPAMTWIVQD